MARVAQHRVAHCWSLSLHVIAMAPQLEKTRFEARQHRLVLVLKTQQTQAATAQLTAAVAAKTASVVVVAVRRRVQMQLTRLMPCAVLHHWQQQQSKQPELTRQQRTATGSLTTMTSRCWEPAMPTCQRLAQAPAISVSAQVCA